MSQMYNTKKFVDIYDTVTTFTTDYATINLGGITDQALLNKLYYYSQQMRISNVLRHYLEVLL